MVALAIAGAAAGGACPFATVNPFTRLGADGAKDG